MSVHYIRSNVFYVFKYKDIIKINNVNNHSLDLIIIDNFYENPDEVRNFALLHEFNRRGNFPGYRTHRTFASNELYENIKFYINNIGYNIIHFSTEDFTDGNCTFTVSIENNTCKSYIHYDEDESFNEDNGICISGVIYLTPNAPFDSGTIFYEFDYENNKNITNINEHMNEYTFDTAKWKKKDIIGNVYNRMILFNSRRHHSINKLFGTNKYNGRLTQNFFFVCVKK
jgi:hypothetical protein